jgi:hypothetical protein
MARRSAPPPRPAAPILTLEQKRYRIERFRVCIQRLEDFDPEKVQRRVGVPEVVTLEAGIDNALSATFGYGTPSYFRFNLAARLDVGPHVTSTALEGTVPRSVGGPGSHDERAAQEARRYFSAGKARSIALLREAICTLEAEVSDTRAAVGAAQQSEATRAASRRNALRNRVRGGFALKAAWRRMQRLWRGSRQNPRPDGRSVALGSSSRRGPSGASDEREAVTITTEIDAAVSTPAATFSEWLTTTRSWLKP